MRKSKSVLRGKILENYFKRTDVIRPIFAYGAFVWLMVIYKKTDISIFDKVQGLSSCLEISNTIKSTAQCRIIIIQDIPLLVILRKSITAMWFISWLYSFLVMLNFVKTFKTRIAIREEFHSHQFSLIPTVSSMPFNRRMVSFLEIALFHEWIPVHGYSLVPQVIALSLRLLLCLSGYQIYAQSLMLNFMQSIWQQRK